MVNTTFALGKTLFVGLLAYVEVAITGLTGLGGLFLWGIGELASGYSGASDIPAISWQLVGASLQTQTTNILLAQYVQFEHYLDLFGLFCCLIGWFCSLLLLRRLQVGQSQSDLQSWEKKKRKEIFGQTMSI